jgi:hypothetical protein
MVNIQRSSFVSWTGAALAAGGALVALINLVLTPRLVSSAPFEQTAASSIYVWRQSLSAVAVGLLLFGSIGFYLSYAERHRVHGAVAFVVAFVGSALVMAWEWVEVFVLHELALRAPETLAALENTKGLSLYDLGALIPFSLFALGWLAVASWSWRVTPAYRLPPTLIVLGIFSAPLLRTAIGPAWGGAISNAIFGCGLCLLGLQVNRVARAT